MRLNMKRSNKMLLGALIFLCVYLLVTVVFGLSLLDKAVSAGNLDAVSQVSMWTRW